MCVRACACTCVTLRGQLDLSRFAFVHSVNGTGIAVCLSVRRYRRFTIIIIIFFSLRTLTLAPSMNYLVSMNKSGS